MANTGAVSVGQRKMQDLVDQGWIKDFSKNDQGWAGYDVTYTMKFRKAFKAHFGYSAKYTYVGLAGNFLELIAQISQ
jgi:hypothetical protein